MAYEFLRIKTDNYVYRKFEIPDIDKIIYDQSEKYVTFSNTNFYNSAVCIYNNAIYFCLLGTSAFVLKAYYSYNGTSWDESTGVRVNFNYVSNGCYTLNIVKTNTVWNNYYWDVGTIQILSHSGIPVFTNINEFNAYVTSPLVNYTWSSVPSISGKNGIVELATIKSDYINNGDSVTGASASNFNASSEAVVSNMIQVTSTDAEATFTIPALSVAEYTSIKLVGKQGYIPKSKTDGDKILTLSASDTSATIQNLTLGAEYYFVIFTEDSAGNLANSVPFYYMNENI